MISRISGTGAWGRGSGDSRESGHENRGTQEAIRRCSGDGADTATETAPPFRGRAHPFAARAPSPQSPAPSPGFTLLEVLAAIALLAIALAIGLGALGRSARNAAQGVALDTAVERAQSLLAEQGLTTPLKNGVQSGTFDDGMAWTLEIHVLPRTHPASAGAGAVPQPVGVVGAGTAGIDVYQLDVAVQYGDGRTLRLSTQRAQAASPAGNRE